VTTTENWLITPSDRAVLRTLATRLMELAHHPDNLARRQRWLDHNALRNTGPMILAESCGLYQTNELTFTAELRCTEPWAREVETTLRGRLWDAEVLADDLVVDPFFNTPWQVQISDYGVAIEHTTGTTAEHMGSYHWVAPLKNLQEDFALLKPRTFSVDRPASLARLAHLSEVFGPVMPVRLRGSFWWSVGLSATLAKLVGLEELMLYMYDDPAGLHRLMAFLRDDQLAFARWLERENLLTLNNEADWIGSGSRGHTTELPQPDYTPGGPVRLRDLWVLSESQETVGVGPELFAEFIFPYQRAVIQEFGLCYYGCCEPLHTRWPVLQQLPNLRKVSISPWCDEAYMAAHLGNKYIYSRKPNPTLISTDTFDETAIRADLRKTLRTARGCHVELIMKDVHTVAHQPQRLARWVQLARETIAECT